MNEILRLGKNSLWLLAARLGAQALALVSLLLARKLGSAGFGEYAFFSAVVFIANVWTTFGTDMFFIREIAARDDLTRLPAALWLQLILSAAGIAGIALGAPLIPNQSAQAVAALQIYSLALAPLAFYSVFSTALRGRQHMGAYALLNFVGALLQAAVVLLFLGVGNGVIMLAWLLLSAQCLSSLLAGWLCTRQIAGFWRGWRFSWVDVRDVARASAPLGGLSILGMAYQKLGLLLVSTLGGATLAGFFSAALRAVEAAKTGHLAAFTALYPALAQNSADPAGRGSKAIRLSWKLLLAAALALALTLSLLAGPLIDVLFGADFAPAAPALRVLAWVLAPYTANTFLTLAFVAEGRERAVGLALTASLLGLGLASMAWIPAYGSVGAAWAALGAECVQSAALLLQVKRNVPKDSLKTFQPVGRSDERKADELPQRS